MYEHGLLYGQGYLPTRNMCLHGVYRLRLASGIQKRNPDRIWRLVIAPWQRLLQGLP